MKHRRRSYISREPKETVQDSAPFCFSEPVSDTQITHTCSETHITYAYPPPFNRSVSVLVCVFVCARQGSTLLLLKRLITSHSLFVAHCG